MDLRFAVLHLFPRRHNFGIFSLLGCWIVGMLLGLSFAFFADHSVLLMMRGWCYLPVTIVDLLTGSFFSLLLSALAVYQNESWVLCPILAAKAFSFSFCACIICRCFKTAGWLVCGLLSFSSWFSAVLLLHFSLMAAMDRAKALARFPWFAVVNLTATLVDIYFVAPILSGAING